jgi:hypothetical protein
MIELDPERVDGNGFPVVSWIERRNGFAPDGAGLVRIECSIREDWRTGTLLISVMGGLRAGEAQIGRSWEALTGFDASATAQQLFYPGSQSSGMRHVQDNARVIQANFLDDRPSLPLYVNRADASEAAIRELHSVLTHHFLSCRDHWLRQINDGQSHWPAGREWKGIEHALTQSWPPGGKAAIQALPADLFERAKDWLIYREKEAGGPVFWQVETRGRFGGSVKREIAAASVFQEGRIWVFRVQSKAPDGSARSRDWRWSRVKAFRRQPAEKNVNVIQVAIEGQGWQSITDLGSRDGADAGRLVEACQRKFVDERDGHNQCYDSGQSDPTL